MSPVCRAVVGIVSTDFQYHVPPSTLPRIEIRQCGAEVGETLQLVAWERDQTSPALSINTDDFGVVQMAARSNVFVFETSGATRDQIFVIVYDQGKPRLALKRTTRGTAKIAITTQEVEVSVVPVSVGDVTERAMDESFPLDPNGMKVPKK